MHNFWDVYKMCQNFSYVQNQSNTVINAAVSYLQELYSTGPLNQERVPEDQQLQEIHMSEMTTI